MNSLCPKSEVYRDEWDELISEFGLDSEPMPLPMSKTDIKKRLLSRFCVQNFSVNFKPEFH
jgi:hypothetical protein